MDGDLNSSRFRPSKESRAAQDPHQAVGHGTYSFPLHAVPEDRRYLSVESEYSGVTLHLTARFDSHATKCGHASVIGWAVIAETQNPIIDRSKSRALEQNGRTQTAVAYINGKVSHLSTTPNLPFD